MAKCKMTSALRTNLNSKRLQRSQRADDRGLWFVLTVGLPSAEPSKVTRAEEGLCLLLGSNPQDTLSEVSNVYSYIL